jgi:hypothetical protein
VNIHVKDSLPSEPSLLTAVFSERSRVTDAREDMINVGLTLAMPDKVEHGPF